MPEFDLLVISLGLSRIFPDNHEMSKQGMIFYDALYAWCCSATEQCHG